MAQERKTFKWGDQEYLLDDLLKLHAQHENSYYDFAKTKGQYDENALSGLRSAIANRINAVKSGQAFEGDGVLTTDTADNVKIQTQKKGLFKKDKYVDQDNTEWAKYYLNKLVSQLKPHNKEEKKDTNAWDNTKHGFGAYLTGQGLNAQEIFQNYDLQDEDNPDAERTTANRRKLLKSHLQGYRDWLAKKGFDFSKNDNDWDDNYLTDYDKFIADFDNLDDNALAQSLRKFNAGDEYTTAFTSKKWDLSQSDSESAESRKKAAADKKAKEEKEKYQQYMKDTYGAFKALSDNNFGGTYFTSSGDGLFDMSEYETWLNTHTNDKDAYMKNLQDSYYNNPFDTKVAGEYLPLAARFGALKDVTIDGKVYKYDPRTIDRTKNRFVAFNPESGEIKHAFIGDIEEELKNLRRKWRIDNGYENESDKYLSYNKDGGILSMQTGGGFNLTQAVNRDLEERNKKRAKETGHSEEIQKARDRVVSNGDDSFTSEDPSIASPDAGFTGAEIARLVSIGADITSMFLDPITGTAVGLGSSLTNFGADIADDGFQWSDVGNLGINIGFDLLGAIPIFGDIVGTGSKITKNLLKWAPRAMAGLAAYQGVANFDGMMGSWSKLTSGDKDQKLTVQDWRNIAQSIGLLTGATRAIKNKAAQKSMKKQAKVEGVVGVDVLNKQTGKVEQLLVDGETAKAVIGAKGNAREIKKTLSELEGYKDKFDNGTLEIVTKGGSWQKPIGRTTKDDGSKSWDWQGFKGEGRASVNNIYDWSKVPQGYGASMGFKIPGVSNYLNNLHYSWMGKLNSRLGPGSQIDARGTKTSAKIDELKALRDPINAELKNLQTSMSRRASAQARIKKELTPERKKLQNIQTRLRGVADEATLNTNKATLEQNIAKNDADMANSQQLLTQAQQDYAKLFTEKDNRRRGVTEEDVQNAQAKIKEQQDALNGYLEAQQQYQVDLKILNSQLQDYANLTPIQANINRLQGIQGRLGRNNHTNAYNRLRQLLQNYQTNHANVGGKSMDWDMTKILNDAGIKNAFRQGGSINRNKINKFLNYDKR